MASGPGKTPLERRRARRERWKENHPNVGNWQTARQERIRARAETFRENHPNWKAPIGPRWNKPRPPRKPHKDR